MLQKIASVEKKLEGAEGEVRKKIKEELKALDSKYRGSTMQMVEELQKITGLETRLTILGHLQRWGTPSQQTAYLQHDWAQKPSNIYKMNSLE